MSQAPNPLRRPYQKAALDEFTAANNRFWALLWERQAGKSTTFADFALYEMLSRPNHTVIYASASLLLAQELPIKTALRTSQTISQMVEGDAAILKQFADTAQSRIDNSPLAPIGGEAQGEGANGSTGAEGQGLSRHSTATADEGVPTQSPYIGLAALLFSETQPIKPGPRPEGQKWDQTPLWPLSNASSHWPAIQPAATIEPTMQFKTYDSLHDREIKKYTADDFAELFSQQRLEFRVYYDRTSYSRTKVIAPNIATARSWSGTVLLDEVAFIRNLRELITALLPVISTDKQFKLILSTTPPEFDDSHYSFELLAPPAGLSFEHKAEGNWYTSESGIRVHRADAFDTALAGKKIFDLKTGLEISPQEAFTRAPNKDGHRIAHWLTWMVGGSAACDLLRLRTAQERGAGQCQNFQISTDLEMVSALNWLSQNLGGRTNASPSPGGEGRGEGELNTDIGRDAALLRPWTSQRDVPTTSPSKVGIGFDVATTTKGKSNPSVISIMEEHGPEWIVRARFIWKTRDPETANQRLHSIMDVLERRGIRPRALAQDATNERYYAEQNRVLFRRRLPVILVVASQAVEKPGLDKPTNWKEYLGNQLIAKLDDNNLTLPPDDYTRTDYRLVMRDRGRFVCEPNDQGMHGDCFDADKLAGHALSAISNRRTIVAMPFVTPQPRPF